jgi:hypothetical protein
MLSFLNSLISGHGGLQVTQYIPSTLSLSLMPGAVAMKWTLRHLSHMMPMWTGMGGDYGTMRIPIVRGRSHLVVCNVCVPGRLAHLALVHSTLTWRLDATSALVGRPGEKPGDMQLGVWGDAVEKKGLSAKVFLYGMSDRVSRSQRY